MVAVKTYSGILVLLIFLMPLIDYVSADGMIIPEPIPEVRNPELAVQYHHVNVTINNQVAVTSIDQVFRNEYYRDLEGTYIFPLPEEASISKFSMYVENEELEGELLGKEEAREIYESIVRRLKDPALLEYVGRDLFKARVYPIPARGEKRIKLEYSEVIACEAGICKYLYPLEIEKYSSKPLESVVITVKLESAQPIKAVYSPTHDILVRKVDDFNVEVSFEENNMKPDRDFELYYTVSDEDFGINLLPFKELGEDGFFMLLLAPKYDLDTEIIPKDIVFVLDTSGSMAGEKILQAKNALEFCVNNLNDEDRFTLITFSTDVVSFSEELLPASHGSRDDALNFIEGIKATGGTNINDALRDALDLIEGGDRPKTIIFLTDGRPTVGVTDIKRIASNVRDFNSADTRVFVFGVGYDVNTHLLDSISQENKGDSEYVKPEEDIEVKVSGFYSKIRNPVLSDLSLSYSGVDVEDIYPREIPDLFKGSQLVLLGRYSGDGDMLVNLKGNVGEEVKEFTYEVSLPEDDLDNDFIPRLWASRKIGYLMDQIRLHGEEKELIDSIVDLSLEYGIMTPYTSFLVDIDTEGGFDDVREEAQRIASSSPDPLIPADAYGKGAVNLAQTTDLLRESEVYQSGSVKVKSVGVKTFFYRNDTWVDNDFSDESAVEITYGSDAYFKLLENNPQIGKYLSLGTEVKFCVGSECFSIGGSGESTEQGGDITLTTVTTVPGKTVTTVPGDTTPHTTVSGDTTSTTVPGVGDVFRQTAVIFVVILVFVLSVLAVNRKP